MKRSKFSLSHYKLLTANQGKLIPLTWYEALPGDSIQQSTSLLIRMQPILAPIMHPVKVRIHHWFVPNRLIWDDWEDFITGGPDGTFEAQPPTVTNGSTVSVGGLNDYMGVPPGSYSGNPIIYSALPFRAYNLIWNTMYRDEDLQDEQPFDTTSGQDTTPKSLLNVAWEKDYFTTARPWPQKGDDILIPISGEGYVSGLGKLTNVFNDGGATGVYESGGILADYANKANINTETVGDNQRFFVEEDPSNAGFPNIRATFSGAEITVNDLREALALQRFQEARARYGSRYVEYLKYLGVRRPSDARLQNPEYLGGGRALISVSEVLQTQRTDEDATPLGYMGGHGIAAMRTRRYRRFFEEHGIVMTLMSIVPKSIYSSAMPKQWLRASKEEYFQKELQYIGQQKIANREINAFNSNGSETFGYQDRYDEYRYMPSSVAGEFRDTLNYWHMAREFAGDVALNESFIKCEPTNRIYTAPGSAQTYIMANHSIQARRILSAVAKPRTF